MKILQTIAVVNQMQADGLFEHYAIGGAVGATFYLEPVSTLDVDIFVAFHQVPGALFINLQPLFDYLTTRGCSMEGEYVIIAGWPVQFLPPISPLVEEALVEALTFYVGDTPTRVCTAEHLAAIALQVGRGKGKARLLQFVEAGVLNPECFQAILVRHHLVDAWQHFARHFLTDLP